jgi:aminoglycoside phosphotransferase (APT) family kinase protein
VTRQASTRDIPAQLKIDAESLRHHLSAVLPELESGLEISKFTGGQSNPTYLIESAGKRFVLRRKPPGTVRSSAHAIDREARVMRAVASAGFPVPEVIHECSDPSIIGSPFYLMSYLDGRIFWNPRLADAPHAEREPIYFALTDTLADLHAIDIDAVGLGDFGPRTDYYLRQIQRWHGQMRTTGNYPGEADRLADWLTRHAPTDDDVTLVHGDHRLDNAVFAHDEPSIIGIIDWELATLGSPMADLSYFLLNWIVPVNHVGGLSLLSADLAELGIPSYEAIIDRYFARSPRDRPDDFAFHHAYNLFRAAAILHGIGARHSAGNASNDNAAAVGQLVQPVLELAAQIARSRPAVHRPTHPLLGAAGSDAGR